MRCRRARGARWSGCLVASHRRAGSWSNRSSAARKRPARWPSLTRWSAASVAVDHAAAATSAPSTTQGRSHDPAEADDRDLRRIDDAEDGLDALLAETRHGDRRVRQLRAAQAAGPGTLHEVAEGAHQVAELAAVGVVQRRCDEPAARSAIATPTCMAAFGATRPSSQRAFSSGNSRSASATAFRKSTPAKQPLGDRPLRVFRLEPGERAARGRSWTRGRSAGSPASSAPSLQRSPGASGRDGQRTRPAGRARSTSCSVIAPSGPVPVRVAGSMPSAAARARATGEMRRRGQAAGGTAAGGETVGGVTTGCGGTGAAGPRAAAPVSRRRPRGWSPARCPPGPWRPAGRAGRSSDAAGEHLDLDQSLLRLDLGDDVAALEPVARLLAPGDERPGLHVGAEDRHDEVSHGAPASVAPWRRWSPPAAAPRPPDAWDRVWYLRAAHPRHRSVEIVEYPFLNLRAQLGGKACRAPSLVDDTARCVRATDASTVVASRGRSARRSITSASIPSAASRSAAASAFWSEPP